jgi:hypothetical protein
MDAIAELSADHRQLEQWFDEFLSTSNMWREWQLAQQICKTIRVHVALGRTLFYPAFEKATGDEIHARELMTEDEAIDALIEEIERAGPTEEAFFAKIYVLYEMFKHHILQEEKARGVFSLARDSTLDLEGLGAQLEARKLQLRRAESALD